MHDGHGYFLEELSVGMSESFTKQVSDQDIIGFANVSGDTNPVHLEDDFARRTRFKERIAHGLLSASFISAVLGTRLPGPGCIYLSQNLKFRAPVRIGDTVTAKATITAIDPDKGKIDLETVCTVGEKVVIDGQAQLLVTKRTTIPEVPPGTKTANGFGEAAQV